MNGTSDGMLDLALRVFRVNAAARRVLEVRPERVEVLRVLGEIADVEGEVGALAALASGRESAQMIYGWASTLERARRSLEALRIW